MEKEVRTQALRMFFVLAVFIGLALWQLEFVIRSIEANVHLNMTIICTFIFGSILAFRSVMSLRNEMVALKALKVQYKDRGTLPEGCYDKPATVYQPPELLGHAFRLISDELTKPQSLTLPTSTVKMLVEGVDVRIDDRKSTLNYIVGLLVFLGLIGTFVGLMQTVGSVGDIIGSLNFGGDGGPSIDEAFSGLIADLQGPLVGMATGFSSSLFGLLCSLALGLIERFGTAAHRILPLEFESWLTNIAQLESASETDIIEDTDLEALERIARLEARMGETAKSARKSADTVQEMLVSIHAIADGLKTNSSQTGLSALSDLAKEMAHTQRGFMEQLDLIRELGEVDRETTRDIANQISQGFANLSSQRAGQNEVLSDLRYSIEKIATGASITSKRGDDNDEDAAEQNIAASEGLFGGRSDRKTRKRLEKEAKALRAEYHAMVREMLEKAFRRDGAISDELEGIRAAEQRQDDTLEALVEHARAQQAQQRVLSEQVEVLAAVLSQERQDQTVLDEIRKSRVGMELALRQISSQLIETREDIETRAILSQNSGDADDLQKAG